MTEFIKPNESKDIQPVGMAVHPMQILVGIVRMSNEGDKLINSFIKKYPESATTVVNQAISAPLN